MKEILLSNALGGIIIGILTSCPMGPVGVLCIRRTLHRGRQAGLITGIGAALSDVTYAALVYLGVGLLLDLIKTYEQTLTLLGSLIILVFGAFLYFSPPHYDTKDSAQANHFSRWKMLLSSYALTFSNPLIVFFFIAFFGRYQFVHDAPYYWWVFAYSMIFILLGALLWWLGITWLISHFRSKMSLASMRLFNRIVALLFVAVAIGGVVSFLYSH